MPRRIRLLVEYDGTDFHGWQLQGEGPGAARTVQGELERAVAQVTQKALRVCGASRTDVGVHSAGQVAHVDLPDDVAMAPDKLQLALNAQLPQDVSIGEAAEMPAEWHAVASSTGKRYRYRIHNRHARCAVRRRTHWHVKTPLDLEAMRAAAQHLLGTHDFTAFVTMLSNIQAIRAEEGKDELNTVKEIRKVSLRAAAACGGRGWLDEVVLDIEGSGFLYKMVRTIAGSLVVVGRGKEPPEWLGEVLASKDRRRAGPTAPAQGLSLIEVLY